MKIIRYEWEDHFFNSSVSDNLSYDSIENVKTEQAHIKYTAPITRNIDYSKLLAFGYVFGPMSKKFLSSEQSKDKNPLKKTTKKMVSSKQFVHDKLLSNIIMYIVLVYLYAYFKRKNIPMKQKSNKNTFNLNLKEINSILKVAYPYNILDLDPSITINFSGSTRNQTLVNHHKSI